MQRTRLASRRRAACLVAGLSLLASGCWARQAQWEQSSEADQLTRKQGESEAEALYRAGVRCHDEFERDECAIEYFEKLIAKNPNESGIVSDAFFRLYTLYQQADRGEDAVLLLRKYWEAGNERGSSGNLHYPARWLPRDFSVLWTVETATYRKSRLSQIMSADAHDSVFSCDEARVAELEAKAEAKRIERWEKQRDAAIAAGKEPPPDPREKEEKSEEEKEEERLQEAVYTDNRCVLARALGTTDISEWTRMTSASNAMEGDRSAGIYSISRIEKRIGEAVAAGSLIALEDGTWQLPEVVHGKAQRVRIAIVDLDTIVLAGDEVMDEMLTAKSANEVTLSPALSSLTKRVPEDVTFFTVMAPEAIKLGMNQAGALASLLPEPEGMMMAGVAYDYVGFFVRMPTSEAMKAGALVSMLRWALQSTQEQGTDGGDPATRAFRDMDISQSPDGKALLMSTVLPSEAIESMLTQ